MKSKTRLSLAWRSASKDAAIVQLPMVLLAGMVADSGWLFAVSLRAVAKFWLMTLIMTIRRPVTPSPTDLRVLRFGYLVILPICVVVAANSRLWENGW